MDNLELVTHKPSKWALAGFPLYALGVMMLLMPAMTSVNSAAELALTLVVMLIGAAILFGALFAFAGYEGVTIRGESRTIETWWRLLGVSRRRSFRVSDAYTVVVKAHRARAHDTFTYTVSIAAAEQAKHLEQLGDRDKARELARGVADRLQLAVRDES